MKRLPVTEWRSWQQLQFDDEVIGEHCKVSYTHHEPSENGEMGSPKYLAMKITGEALSFYLIGVMGAKIWILQTDAKINHKKNATK
jgi:hypothetical protein